MGLNLANISDRGDRHISTTNTEYQESFSHLASTYRNCCYHGKLRAAQREGDTFKSASSFLYYWRNILPEIYVQFCTVLNEYTELVRL